jgi:phosphatidylglycerophosphate synthase
MLKLFREFKNSLKDTSVEDVMDLFIFRPIAFILVKLIYRLPVTPNQLSILAILSGIVSGVFFALGSPRSFVYAGFFYALAHIFDCCDGMIARLKKNGTFIGRIVDGFADYTTTTAVFVGFNIGLYRAGFEFFVTPWILVASSGFCMIVHSIVVDYYRSEFMAHALKKVNSTQAERELFGAELKKLNREKGKYFSKLVIWVYLGYSRIQLFTKKEKTEYDPDTYYRSNRLLLSLWSWIASPTYVAVVIISAILFRPVVLFYYSLIAGNIWMIVLLIFQMRTNKKIAKKPGS